MLLELGPSLGVEDPVARCGPKTTIKIIIKHKEQVALLGLWPPVPTLA